MYVLRSKGTTGFGREPPNIFKQKKRNEIISKYVRATFKHVKPDFWSNKWHCEYHCTLHFPSGSNPTLAEMIVGILFPPSLLATY